MNPALADTDTPVRGIVLLSRDPAVLRQAGSLMLAGCQVESLMRGTDLLERLRRSPIDLLLIHPNPVDMDTDTLLSRLEGEGICPPWAVLAAPDDAQGAVAWMKRGALEVLPRGLQWEHGLAFEVDRLLTRADSLSRLRQARREREEQIRVRDLMLDGMPGLVLAMTAEGRLVGCNPAARQLGFLPGEAMSPGEGARDWSPPSTLFSGMETLRRVQEWEGLGFDAYWSVREGLAICLALQRGPRQEEERRRRRLERRRLQSQKLDALRELAQRMSHGVNNQLLVIQSAAEMLHHRLGEDPKGREWTRSLLDAAQALEEQTRALGLLGRTDPTPHEPVELHELLRAETERIRLRFPLVRTRLNFESSTALVPGRPALLAGALASLLVNAGEAMPEGGLLLVQSRLVSAGLQRDEHEPPTHLQILISDSGAGMDDETLERALDPYYSTREGHAGLGLSQAWACMRAHRGELELESAPGRGCQVRLLFPLRENRTPAGLRRRTGRVLLVDDDEVVRGVVGSILRTLGWTVEAFGSGPEALAWLDAEERPLDLALLDLRMPLMNGWELMQELRLRDARLRTLLMTAWADDLPRERLEANAVLGVLAKPFELDELHAALELAMQRLENPAA